MDHLESNSGSFQLDTPLAKVLIILQIIILLSSVQRVEMLGEYLGVKQGQELPGGWEIARARPVDLSRGGVTKIDGKINNYLNTIC